MLVQSCTIYLVKNIFIFEGVLFVSLEGTSTRYLLTLQKSDKINKVKEELKNLIGRPVDDIILAEALDSHISRILVSGSTDEVLIRFDTLHFLVKYH